MSCGDYKPKPVLTRAIEEILIMHVDHEHECLDIDSAHRRPVGRQAVCVNR